MYPDFRAISWDISEPNYRLDPALSYSNLSTYQTVGFKGLSTLFDRKESPSLKFGSGVDTLMTGSKEEFDELFAVADMPVLSDQILNIVTAAFSLFKDKYTCLEEFTKEDVDSVLPTDTFYTNWKNESRWKKVLESGGGRYYQLLFTSEGKTLISTETYNKMLEDVEALKTRPATRWYFEQDNPFNPEIQRLYQLKFKHKLNTLGLGEVEYRCMADLIVVNHKDKTVQPCDLKTSSCLEYEFYDNFVKWHYQIQARLYWRIIRAVMDESEEFKDYKLLDYKFIDVNNQIGVPACPTVWDFPLTQAVGTQYLGDHELPDPEQLGNELSRYLSESREVPFEVKIGENESNNILDFFKK